MGPERNVIQTETSQAQEEKGPRKHQALQSNMKNRASTALLSTEKGKPMTTKPATQLHNRFDSLLSLCDDESTLQLS